MLFNYWLTDSVLKAKRPKIQRMRRPVAAEAAHTGANANSSDKSAMLSHNGNVTIQTH